MSPLHLNSISSIGLDPGHIGLVHGKTKYFILKETGIEASIILFMQQRLKKPRFKIFMQFKILKDAKKDMKFQN
jgi:hypothetical protein